MPRLAIRGGGRELFAEWTPKFEGIHHEFETDANDYDLVSRKVFKLASAPFSSSLYPIDAAISIHDSLRERSLTIFNDRPQAGSVYDDHSLKLLIDRRVQTSDTGGFIDPMSDHQIEPFDLSFRVRP